jgi:hypothetical protein
VLIDKEGGEVAYVKIESMVVGVVKAYVIAVQDPVL